MRHLTEMLEEGNTAPDRLSQYYRALGRETRRLHEMVESLLDFGRLESGRRTFQMEETDVMEFTERVVEDFREGTHAGSHRLELSKDETLRAPLNVRVDREALTLAFRNLLDNAIKYSPETSVVQICVAAEDGVAGISVQDRGCGIPRDEQRTVFRKFVRGSSAKTLNVKGAGIGLTMALQIVRAHGGRLELRSEPGEGSRFTMILPTCG
jgi:signal transduction histidine kinase